MIALQLARCQAEERIRKEALAEIRTCSLELDKMKARTDENNSMLLADLDRMIESLQTSRKTKTEAEISLDHARKSFLQQTEIVRRQARQEALEREQDRANQARTQVKNMCRCAIFLKLMCFPMFTASSATTRTRITHTSTS